MNFTLTSAANAGVLIECGGTRLLLDGIRRRDDQDRLPVEALDSDGLERAMDTWEPAGPGDGRARSAP